MIGALVTLAENLGFGLPNVALILFTLAGLVFFAHDFRLGVIMEFFVSFVIFIACLAVGANWAPSLVAGMIWLVVMSFTLYFGSRTPGGFV